MLAKGNGKVLNVASTAAFQPGPSMAVYYATKAFVLSFDTETKRDLSANLEVYLIDNRDELTALVCYNDEVGLEVVHVCRKLGISIPDELSIIGQDNSYFAKNANIQLTTLTHPQEQMGRDAADWVIKNLQGKKDLPTNTYYQPVFIEGETVKAIEVE